MPKRAHTAQPPATRLRCDDVNASSSSRVVMPYGDLLIFALFLIFSSGAVYITNGGAYLFLYSHPFRLNIPPRFTHTHIH